MTKTGLTKAIRIGVIAVFLLVILSIGWYFISHRRPATAPQLKVEDITPQKVERQEGIEHFHFRGDRVIQAKAARHYAGENGRYYLEGNVEIIDRGEKGKPEIFISGNKASYDKDWTDVFLDGTAKLKYGDLTAESASFSYQKSPDVLSTDKGVAFSSRRLFGRAIKMVCSFKEDSIRLEGDVELQITDKFKSSAPFVIRGDLFTYSRRAKRGRAEGNAAFSQGQSHGQAESLDFELTEDEQNLKTLLLKGKIKVYLVQEGTAESLGGSIILAKAMKREISADEMNLKAFPDMPKINTLEAKGNCFLRSAASSGESSELRSEEMNILFGRAGRLRELNAQSKADMVEKGKDDTIERAMSGNRIYLDQQGEILRVWAGKEADARAVTRDSEITAREISLNPQKEILDAKDNVKAIFKFQADQAATGGFFSSEGPVFITCQAMRYEKSLDRLLLRENVRMWQEKKMLFAETLTVLEKTADISGEGRVRAVCPFTPQKEGGKEERIEMGGEKMALIPKTHLLTFERDCWLKAQNIDLKSESLVAYLREDKSDIQSIKAKGNVIIKEQTSEGRGAQALYDLDKDTIVLTGNPTLIDKEKGIIEGDKLTFHLGDGKIVVENKDRERSVTINKS
jgi:lipopolysaccharide transport protein LptA